MSNKDLVKTALMDLYLKRDLTALDRYWDAGYVQHNPRMLNGTDFLKKLVSTLNPEFRYEPGLAVEDGDFVMIHGRYVGWGEKTMIAVDIFRIKDGKLAEHWDVIQEEIPAAQAASGNSMFPIA